MLVYVRHGKTALNQPGDGEKLRGWLPVPLAKEGEQQADAAGARLVQRGVQPTTFETSDLHRALQTAGIVGQHLGVQATPNSDIRDWNTGSLAGKKADDVMPLVKHLVAHPDEPAPGGEPYNDYINRFVPAMKAKVESPGVHVVIGHARGASILEGLASPVGGVGKDIDTKFVMEKPRVPPGGILIVNSRWGTQIDDPSTEKMSKEDS